MASYYQRHPSLAPLAHRDFRLLLAGSTLVSLAMPFQFLTQVFWCQAEYPGQAILFSSILTTARGAAMVLFSLLGGAIADRFERRRVLLVTESLSLVSNAVVALLMITLAFGHGTVWAVALVTFFSAGVMSIDSPARSASIPVAAGRENIASAIGLLALSNQLMLPIALPLVGVLNGVIEPGTVYAGSLVAWIGIIPMISMLRFHSVGGGAGASVTQNIREGLSYTRGSRPIFAVLAIVIIVQLLGMPVATPLGPMFLMDVLHFSNAQVGFMGATWGLGAFAASAGFTRMRPLTLRAVTLAAVSSFFAITVLGFGYSRMIAVTAVFDFGMGFGFVATMLTSSTLVQHLVNDAMRGRVMSLFPFSQGIAYLCTALIGAAGQALGLAVLIPLLGWATLVGCLAVIGWHRQLIGARIRAPVAAAAETA